MKALGKYVDGKNHHYPKEARKNKIEGKVIVQFIINDDGTLDNFKVIQGIGYGCDEAAVEAFKKMPKWKPALLMANLLDFRRRWDIYTNCKIEFLTYEFIPELSD